MGHRSRAEWWWVMMWCAVLVALAVLIWPGNKSGRLYRLAYRGRAVDSAAINEPRYAGSPRVGVAQVITSAIARLRGGGTLVEGIAVLRREPAAFIGAHNFECGGDHDMQRGGFKRFDEPLG